MLRTQILELMHQVDREFVPLLSSTVDLEAYVDKMITNAFIFQISDRGLFAGFIALYCNDTVNKVAYVTMVAIDGACRGKGFAGTLVRTAIEHSRRAGFRKLALEAYKSNTTAIHLYKKLGFRVAHDRVDSLILEVVL